MILICGIEVDPASLPLAKELEYKVNSNLSLIPIALKTQARTESCVKVYLKRGVSIPESTIKPIESKLVYFDSEADLVSMLRGTSVESKSEVNKSSVDSSEESSEQMVMDSTGGKTAVGEPKLTTVSSDSAVGEIQEVSMNLPDIFMRIPMDDDEDSLKQLLRSKDNIIEQQKLQLQEFDATLLKTYSDAEQAINSVKEAYDKKLDEATVAVNTLKKQLNDEINYGYGKFKVYGQYRHAYLQEGLSDKEKACLPKDYSNIEVIACGGGQSLYRMFDMVKKNMDESKQPYVFIDITGDYVSTLHYGCKDVALLLKDSLTAEIETKFTEGCRKQGSSVIASCDPYHDILLLGVNWGTFLNNVTKLFGNKVRVFILLNSIQSFAVEFTLAKLATILKSYIFVKSSPVLIKYLYGKMNTIPVARGIKWLASDYFESVHSMLSAVSAKYSVVTNGELFSLDTIQ